MSSLCLDLMNEVTLDSPDNELKESSKVRRQFDTTERGMLTNIQDESEDEDEGKKECDLPELEAQESTEEYLSKFYDGDKVYCRSNDTLWPLFMSIFNGERIS